ncbi:MAG: hypothetical protein IJ062_12465 [Firmicutes bacterium]|nr:hypothetical protein [Bacillota bacterium]
MSLAEKNRLHNKNFITKGFIYSQRRRDIAEMRFGLKPMWYNGCGIIAVYNALLLLGFQEDFRKITEYFERRGKMLWGLFGTKPWSIIRYFKKSGFKIKLCRPKNAENGVYVITVWNKRPGMHYMALKKAPDGIQVYNGYRRHDTYDFYPDFDSFFKDTGITCLLLLKIG